MIVKNSKKEKNTVTFDVELDAAEFEKYVNGAYLKARSRIMVPGFRKGKAPRMVIEGMYGKDVFYDDAFDNAANDAFAFGVAEGKLETVGRPTMTDSKVTEENGALLSFSTDVYPEVTLGQYKGLEAEKPSVEVTDEEVDGHIERLRKQNARLITVERPARDGDTVNINYAGMLDGIPFDGGTAENQNLVLGSNTFVPGFEEQIVGMNIGDEKDINITFPEDYTAELAGKDVVFKVKLNGLSMTELPELDDDFVQDVSEFNTVEEYRADTRKDMERVMDEQMDAKFRTAIMTKACDNMTVEIPESMLQEKIDELIRSYAANFGLTDPKMSTDDIKKMMGLDEEAINSTIRPAAEYQVKQELLLNAIVEAENIEVTDEELEDYIKGAAETVGATPEQIRQYFGDEYIRNEFKKEKATKVVIESATEEAPAEEPAEKEAE